LERCGVLSLIIENLQTWEVMKDVVMRIFNFVAENVKLFTL